MAPAAESVNRPRKAARADSARSRDQILEVAERLLAEHGLEGVSLRQIGAASGNGNNSVVQYHFGSKAGLIREIIARRRASFEPRRRALLEDATRRGRLTDVKVLLEILLRPLAEAADAEGRHIYARFMMQFLTRFQYEEGLDHPAWAQDSAALRAGELLAGRLSFLTPEDLVTRVNRVTSMLMSALIERDNALAQGRRVAPEAVFLADIFGMMAAAIAAPPPADE